MSAGVQELRDVVFSQENAVDNRYTSVDGVYLPKPHQALGRLFFGEICPFRPPRPSPERAQIVHTLGDLFWF